MPTARTVVESGTGGAPMISKLFRSVLASRRQIQRRNRSVLRLERLESREVPTGSGGDFVVNTLQDTHDVNPGDGVALDGNGNVSLRSAIEEANAEGGVSTITFSVGGIAPPGGGANVIWLTQRMTLDIAVSLSINGT